MIPIPYRVMVPETVGNLICPGGGRRHAAAAANADGLAFRDVDVHRLRTSRADDGAIVSL